MTQSIHQRVAERLNLVALTSSKCSFTKDFTVILAEEYGPLIEAAKRLLADSSPESNQAIAAEEALRAELSKKGLI